MQRCEEAQRQWCEAVPGQVSVWLLTHDQCHPCLYLVTLARVSFFSCCHTIQGLCPALLLWKTSRWIKTGSHCARRMAASDDLPTLCSWARWTERTSGPSDKHWAGMGEHLCARGKVSYSYFLWIETSLSSSLFPVAVIKSQRRLQGIFFFFFLGHSSKLQSTMAGKSRQWELQATGHTRVEVRRGQRRSAYSAQDLLQR